MNAYPFGAGGPTVCGGILGTRLKSFLEDGLDPICG